ncbi:MAG: hypothetical protein LBU34_09665 [Planctomycetaceae bacterium]|jgi:hypothetical protein|nr:hypothetical protein [Planctomycetaceae bacterium]
MKLLLPAFVCLLWLTICIGCNKVTVPDELKNLCPVTIAVIDGHQPVEGVTVRLVSKEPRGVFASNGITDSKGIAKLRSSRGSYTGNGVPAGIYSVVLLKTVDFTEELMPTEADQNLSPSALAKKQSKQEEFLEKNRIIPKILEASNSSPIEITVTNKTDVTMEIDLSKYKK